MPQNHDRELPKQAQRVAYYATPTMRTMTIHDGTTATIKQRYTPMDPSDPPVAKHLSEWQDLLSRTKTQGHARICEISRCIEISIETGQSTYQFLQVQRRPEQSDLEKAISLGLLLNTSAQLQACESSMKGAPANLQQIMRDLLKAITLPTLPPGWQYCGRSCSEQPQDSTPDKSEPNAKR